MQLCTRRIQFCAGHRVAGHESKCSNLHGHNYILFVTAQAEELDGIGRVIDFSVLKDLVGGWVESNWDHGLVLWKHDDEALALVRELRWRVPGKSDPMPQKLYELPVNPTAENMASFLVREICPVLLTGSGVRVVRAELWETENCLAVYDVRD